MNREEAISELQKAIDLIKQNGKDWLDERDIPILQMAITALELSDSIMLQLDCKMFHSGVNVDNIVSDETTDIIYRQAAIDAMINSRSNADVTLVPGSYTNGWRDGRKLLLDELLQVVFELPSVQPEPLSDAYMKAVWTWLLDYQIKAAELKGRYTPYEVLSWVANDWRKEHEGSD